jgi:hypothetical protein
VSDHDLFGADEDDDDEPAGEADADPLADIRDILDEDGAPPREYERGAWVPVRQQRGDGRAEGERDAISVWCVTAGGRVTEKPSNN